MFCSDKLLGDIAKVKCPQNILRGFTGNITIKDWRGFNSFNPDSSYLDTVSIEANPTSIKPESTPEVREDNLTVYIHKLSFSVKNMSDDVALSLAKWTNIPLIIELELESGEIMTMFPEAGAKVLATNLYYGQESEYTAITCQHYHREARESIPPQIVALQSYTVDFDVDEITSGDIGITSNTATGLTFSVYNVTQDIVLRDHDSLEGNVSKTVNFTTNPGDIIRMIIHASSGASYNTLTINNWYGFAKTIISEGNPILTVGYNEPLTFKVTCGSVEEILVSKTLGENLQFILGGGISWEDKSGVSGFIVDVAPEGSTHRVRFRLFSSPITINLYDSTYELITEGKYSELYSIA